MSTSVQEKYSDPETTIEDTDPKDPTIVSDTEEETDTVAEPTATIAGAEVDEEPAPPPKPDPKPPNT